MYELLKNALNVSAVRKEIISNNLANINTKNFKRSDVKFESFLNSEIGTVTLKKTNDKHISNENGYYRIVQDNGTSMRRDGNNVDLDIEKANQAANTLMYNALISTINNRFDLFSRVISGGR